MEIVYNIDKNNIHIYDSYCVSKHDMLNVLYHIKTDSPYCDVWNRSMKSLVNEWVVHNFLYKLGLYQDRTKDVDLDYPADHNEHLYNTIAFFVKPFVK